MRSSGGSSFQVEGLKTDLFSCLDKQTAYWDKANLAPTIIENIKEYVPGIVLSTLYIFSYYV